MKKYTAYIMLVIALFSCMNSRSKKNLLSTVKKGNNLYIEDYRSGLIGNLTAQYLTDSANFRVYLGTYDDENGYIFCKIIGDSIHIEQREHGKGLSPKWDTMKVSAKAIYSLKNLKRQHRFE
jgi:hypothetical protein